MLEVIQERRTEILRTLSLHGAYNPRLFGSVARGEATPASDIDLLVDMEPGRTPLDLIGLEQDLTDLLGRPVDVVTEAGISPHLRSRILEVVVKL